MTSKKILATAGVLALGATSAAFAGSPPQNQGTAHKPATTPTATTTTPENQGTAHRPAQPGPSASLPAKAKAYGRYCQGQSRKHVKGQKGTPFSQCVTAMAKAAHSGDTGDDPASVRKTARAACKTMSKKHVQGAKGTPYSQCVTGAAKLLRDQSS